MLDKETQEKFVRYEELKLTIKKAEEELKELSPVLISAIPDGREIETMHGKFTVRNRSVWTYSGEVQREEERLKALKKDEQARGIAAREEVPSLVYSTGE